MADVQNLMGNAKDTVLKQFLSKLPEEWGQLLSAAFSNDPKGIISAMEALSKSGTQEFGNVSEVQLGTGGLTSGAPQVADISRDAGMDGRV